MLHHSRPLRDRHAYVVSAVCGVWGSRPERRRRESGAGLCRSAPRLAMTRARCTCFYLRDETVMSNNEDYIPGGIGRTDGRTLYIRRGVRAWNQYTVKPY